MTVYADVVRYRELFANLFRRNFQARYRGSLLGIGWSLVNPLVLLGVYLLIVGLIMRQNTKIPHYPLYLLAALLPWFFLTPILWSFTNLSVTQSHHKVVDVLRWGNFIAPPIYAIRDSLWLGEAPRIADVIYLAVAAAVALGLGALAFRRVDD